MKKKFNITGTCYPTRHYMTDVGGKLKAILAMVEEGEYFTIDRPRQYGKTTTLFLLQDWLEKADDYLPIRAPAGKDLAAGAHPARREGDFCGLGIAAI
jgi:hypothetical protein